MHFLLVLENIRIYIKTYIKIVKLKMLDQVIHIAESVF
jgi:hypothetical protein